MYLSTTFKQNNNLKDGLCRENYWVINHSSTLKTKELYTWPSGRVTKINQDASCHNLSTPFHQYLFGFLKKSEGLLPTRS